MCLSVYTAYKEFSDVLNYSDVADLLSNVFIFVMRIISCAFLHSIGVIPGSLSCTGYKSRMIFVYLCCRVLGSTDRPFSL